jgi:hypothetical protein
MMLETEDEETKLGFEAEVAADMLADEDPEADTLADPVVTGTDDVFTVVDFGLPKMRSISCVGNTKGISILGVTATDTANLIDGAGISHGFPSAILCLFPSPPSLNTGPSPGANGSPKSAFPPTAPTPSPLTLSSTFLPNAWHLCTSTPRAVQLSKPGACSF